MAPTKMPCKNNEKYTYTGKEMSPLGLGFTADAEYPGTQMIGRDNKPWIVGVKNNEKIWMRLPEKMIPLVKEPPVLTGAAGEDEEDEEDVAGPSPKTEVVATAEEEKKKVVRKAPKEKASTYEEGFQKAGPTGEMYVVKADKNGTKKWTKVPEPKAPKAKAAAAPKAKTDGEAPKKVKITVKKVKPVEGGEEEKPKQKRAPTGYNLWLTETMARLRREHEKLTGKEYMEMALKLWTGMSKDEKNRASAAAKAAAVGIDEEDE